MNLELCRIITFAMDYYEKISAFTFGGGELYMKVYTIRPVKEVVKRFKDENFNVIELEETTRTPKLIENDIEPGVEFFIAFSVPERPLIMLTDDRPDE